MVKKILLLLSVVFLVACQPTDEQIREIASQILTSQPTQQIISSTPTVLFTQKQDQPPTETGWEYLAIPLECYPDFIERELIRCVYYQDGHGKTAESDYENFEHYTNKYGSEGWELVSVIRDPDRPKTMYLFFKRPLEKNISNQ